MTKMTMYRRCTIIGMNNISISVKESCLAILCLAIAIGIRIFLMISGDVAVTDDFHYYQASMMQEEEKEPIMTSGVVFAYTQSLSDISKHTGNRIDVIAVYHILLQAVSFLFLFLGCRYLFGKVAAFWEIMLFSASPYMVREIFKVSPESYYLFGWSLVFLMICILFKRTKERGWYRSNWDELFLMVTGFLLGVVCIWHYTGFLLVILLIYITIRNASGLQEKRDAWKEAYAIASLLDQDDFDEDENVEIMPVILQVIFVAAGMFVGEYCTLMKYTGVTGNFIKGQTIWWLKQLIHVEDGRWQDMAWWFPIWLALSIILGAMLQAFVRFIYNRMKDHEIRKVEKQENKKKENKKKESKKKESKKKESKKKTAAKEEVKTPVETKVEEKKVNYIENPLPLPKKHVSRTLDFKNDGNDDGFDVEVNTNDDFDIT